MHASNQSDQPTRRSTWFRKCDGFAIVSPPLVFLSALMTAGVIMTFVVMGYFVVFATFFCFVLLQR